MRKWQWFTFVHSFFRPFSCGQQAGTYCTPHSMQNWIIPVEIFGIDKFSLVLTLTLSARFTLHTANRRNDMIYSIKTHRCQTAPPVWPGPWIFSHVQQPLPFSLSSVESWQFMASPKVAPKIYTKQVYLRFLESSWGAWFRSRIIKLPTLRFDWLQVSLFNSIYFERTNEK